MFPPLPDSHLWGLLSELFRLQGCNRHGLRDVSSLLLVRQARWRAWT